MRASVPRLVRVIPRNRVAAQAPFAAPIPEPVRSDIKSVSLIEALLKRKAEQGASYPPNIRIEPVIHKKALKNVPADVRKELLEITRER
ncbi:hypothetical protein BDW22DRAFT_1359881 [Trametopsis cervina]|nr:hypothetical protein BDW22DRAFT_1359881 [Trametopsis cervina]